MQMNDTDDDRGNRFASNLVKRVSYCPNLEDRLESFHLRLFGYPRSVEEAANVVSVTVFTAQLHHSSRVPRKDGDFDMIIPNVIFKLSISTYFGPPTIIWPSRRSRPTDKEAGRTTKHLHPRISRPFSNQLIHSDPVANEVSV